MVQIKRFFFWPLGTSFSKQCAGLGGCKHRYHVTQNMRFDLL